MTLIVLTGPLISKLTNLNHPYHKDWTISDHKPYLLKKNMKNKKWNKNVVGCSTWHLICPEYLDRHALKEQFDQTSTLPFIQFFLLRHHQVVKLTGLKLTILLLNTTCSVLANSVDPDQLASEANWSGSALFVIKYLNFYQKPSSSNLIGWKLEVGLAS